MDGIIDSLLTASKQLRNLFKDKGELRGFDDWDTFLGSILLIESAAKQLEQKEE